MSRFIRPSARLLQATHSTTPLPTPARTRITTGLTGLPINPRPLPHLLSLYSSTLSILSQIPASAVYRQAAESITKERESIINTLRGTESEADIEAIEIAINQGVIEEVIDIAEGELKLAGKMLEWKAWEELEVAAPEGQWAPFKQTPSTTTADDLK